MGDKKGKCKFWWGNLGKRDKFEDIRINEKIILKCVLKLEEVARAALIWLGIGTCGRLFLTR
jgi:hypothetical protein